MHHQVLGLLLKQSDLPIMVAQLVCESTFKHGVLLNSLPGGVLTFEKHGDLCPLFLWQKFVGLGVDTSLKSGEFVDLL